MEAIKILDPFGDGTSFSFVFSYAGRIWLGPKSHGTGAVHFAYDGTDPVAVDFSFFRDQTGNDHRNNAIPPYESIGFGGCIEDSQECGPDNEDGRGVFGAGQIDGQEWLWVAGARSSGDLDYVYLTQDTDAVLDFSFLDLSDRLGGGTEGVSSAHAFGDRLFIGFPDSGGSRPYLMLVSQPPAAPGLDPVTNGGGPCDPAIHDVCDLEGQDFPGLGSVASPGMIDSISDFNDRLYLANNGGIVRSTTNAPLDIDDYPGHWIPARPNDIAYQSCNGIETPKTADLEPADKAFPAMAAFGGRLFVIRNTDCGPQLFACAPATVAGPLPWTAEDCDPGDWQLVAPDASGLTTTFDNPGNTHLTLLLATANHLYIGFDNLADGLVILRTANPAAAIEADFEGAGGCSAADHPAACDGLGGYGFGDPAHTRIFSAVVEAVGPKDYLYVITGDGGIPARLVIFGD